MNYLYALCCLVVPYEKSDYWLDHAYLSKWHEVTLTVFQCGGEDDIGARPLALVVEGVHHHLVAGVFAQRGYQDVTG